MRILMYAKALPIHIRGGMERHIEDLVEGLAKRRHEIIIITTKHPMGLKYEEKDNITIYYVGKKPLNYGVYFQKSAVKIIAEKIKDNYDIIHSQSDVGYGYLKYFGKDRPFVVTDHGTLLGDVRSLFNERTLKSVTLATLLFFKGKFEYIFLYKSLYHKCADKIIAVSNELKEDIKREYNIPEEKITVIPNGVDINKFKPVKVDSLREKLNLNNEKIILSVGRIEKQKGFHLLIKITPDILKNHDTKLVIVGTGSYLQALKKMAVKLGISDKIIFTGRVSDNDLLKYYNLADIFAFPTLRIEGFPYVVIEAMACGKPVVTSNIGGIPTAIENGKDGFLIEPNNLKDLKDKILMLLEDEKLAKRIGGNARNKVVKKFSIDKMVEDTIKVYEEVLRK